MRGFEWVWGKMERGSALGNRPNKQHRTIYRTTSHTRIHHVLFRFLSHRAAQNIKTWSNGRDRQTRKDPTYITVLNNLHDLLTITPPSDLGSRIHVQQSDADLDSPVPRHFLVKHFGKKSPNSSEML